jgi:hypothetical protein
VASLGPSVTPREAIALRHVEVEESKIAPNRQFIGSLGLLLGQLYVIDVALLMGVAAAG